MVVVEEEEISTIRITILSRLVISRYSNAEVGMDVMSKEERIFDLVERQNFGGSDMDFQRIFRKIEELRA